MAPARTIPAAARGISPASTAAPDPSARGLAWYGIDSIGTMLWLGRPPEMASAFPPGLAPESARISIEGFPGPRYSCGVMPNILCLDPVGAVPRSPQARPGRDHG